MSHDHEHGKVVAGPICPGDISKVKEAVCIQVEKIYDSCKEKDCIEDAKVIFKGDHVQNLINNAINVKCRKAEVLDVFADVEPVPFKRGFYTIDVKYFIIVTLDFFVLVGSGTRIITKRGLVVFDKKIILFGSEGNVKIFKSKFTSGGLDKPVKTRLEQDNLPISKVEVAEPIALNAKIQDIADKYFDDCCNNCDHIPDNALEVLDAESDDDVLGILDNDSNRQGIQPIPRKRVVVTLGIFSIIKLARFVQLMIPAFNFCVPFKDCIASTDENPCELFETIDFPVNEFFPPQMFEFPGALETEKRMLEEMQR